MNTPMKTFLHLIDKFENANNRWREHWWNEIEDFYKHHQEIRKAYELDIVKWEVKDRTEFEMPKQKKDKEFLYVGHYYDSDGNYILKIGTTNCLSRRQKEHTANYGHNFIYDWSIPLSKYNTLRYEDKNREMWKVDCVGEFIRNDRFLCYSKPNSVTIKIRKEYVIEL